jgi:hypothetical protein
MSSSDVATNQNTGSDQKSDANKQQDQPGSGTDDSKQINGKNVIGKYNLFFSFFLCALRQNIKHKITALGATDDNRVAFF